MLKYFVVEVIILTIQSLIIGYATALMLEAKYIKKATINYTLMSVSVYIIVVYVLKLVTPPKSIALLLANIVLFFVIFKSPIGRTLIAFFLMQMIQLVGDIILTLIFYQIMGWHRMSFDKFEYMLYGRSSFTIILSILAYVCVFLWRYIISKTSNDTLREYLFFIFSQSLIMSAMFYISFSSDNIVQSYTITFIAMVLCIIADYFLFRSIKRSNERHYLAHKNKIVEGQLTTQLNYYNQLTDSIRNNQKLRHDYLNQMQTIMILLERKDTSAAQEHLEQLIEYTSLSKVEKYCDNEIVNAVIDSKRSLCRTNNIELMVDLKIPHNIGIDGVHLCSIFANMLDNAIEACQRSNVGERYIRLNAGIRSKRLIVRMENPVTDGVTTSEGERHTSKAGDHGYGLEILRDIAEQYGGDIDASVDSGNGTFETLINLVPKT